MKLLKFVSKYLFSPHQTKGFTLLELLLAIFISSIVIGSAGYGVVAVIDANRISEQKTTRRVELNRALDYISEDIKGAKTIVRVGTGADQKLRIILPDPYPSFPATLAEIDPTDPTKRKIQYIEYYFEDISADANSVWVRPGVIRRQEFYSTRIASNSTSPPVAGSVQTLVDGISKELPATLVSPPSCNTPEFITEGGFFACINEEFRTVSLSLYGILNTSTANSNNDNVLLVSSKFVTRNIAPRDLCIVPDLVTSPATTADAGELIWTNAGFTGSYTKDGTGNFDIAAQNLTSGATIPCSSSITVASSLCTVGNYVGQTTSTVETSYNAQSFVNALVKNGNPAGFTVFSQDPPPGNYPCSQIVTVTEATCTLPDFTGQTVSAAQTTYTANQFTGNLIRDALDPSSDFTIAEQSLPAGSYFCSSDLTVSEKKCDVPNYVGTNSASLTTTWNTDGGAISITPNSSSSSVYTIGSQSLIPNTRDFCSKILAVKETDTCTVPNLIGMSSTDAQNALNSPTEFLTGEVLTESNSSPFIVGGLKHTTDGTVVAVGSEIDCATPLTLVEKKCTVPNLVGTAFASVPATWNSDGGVVEKSGTFTTVGGQNLTAGSSQFCSSKLEVAGNTLCTVPNFINREATNTSINSDWTGANFTGTLTRSAVGDADLAGIGTLDGVSQDLSSLNFRIFNQSLSAGQSVACSSNITLANNPPTNFIPTATDITVITNPTQYNYTVTLSWNTVPGATGYKLFACPTPVGSSATSCSPSGYPTSYPPIYTGTGTSYTHTVSFTTNNNTQKACYSLQATRGEVEDQHSVVSPLVCLANNYLNAPTGFTRTNSSGNVNNATVVLNWNQVSGATGYRVYRCTVNSGTCDPATGSIISTISSGSTTTFTNNNVDLNGNKNACYLVTATRGVNSSPIGDSAILCGRI